MKKTILIIPITVVITGFCAALLFSAWLTSPSTTIITKSKPGMDRPLNWTSSKKKKSVIIGEHFEKGSGIAAKNPHAWPRFRGADFDNVCKQDVRLADSWPENGPKVIWSMDLGEGHAAPAIYKGKVYLLDYDEEKKSDMLYCLSLTDGKMIWRRWYEVAIKRNHGMSRTIPAVTEQFVVTVGPRCHVMCVDTSTGDLKWGLDLEKDFGTKVPGWYTGQCPLIDNATAIIAPSGKEILLMGVDCATGKIRWQTPNPRGWKMSHSSVMPMTIAGKKMYVYSATGGMAAVSAEEGDKGRLLWETTAWDHKTIAPSPLHLGDGVIMITAGYGAGTMIFKVDRADDSFTIKTLSAFKARGGLASEQQTPIIYQEHLFGILPKDAGGLRQQFVCCTISDPTKILWSSGKASRFGIGPFIIADSKFYILDDNGVLTMAKATTEKYMQIAQTKVLDGHDAWGPIAIAGTRMLLRDSKKMICIDVGANE